MIKVIKSYKTVYPPKDGFTLFTLGVEFEDGDKGLAFAKSEHPPYKSGDEVEVSLAGETGNGTAKYKISKVDSDRPSSSPPTSGPRESQQNQQSSSASSQAPSSVHPATVGMAVKEAIGIWKTANDANGWAGPATKAFIKRTAQDIIDVALALEQGSPAATSEPPTRDTTDYSEERIEF